MPATSAGMTAVQKALAAFPVRVTGIESEQPRSIPDPDPLAEPRRLRDRKLPLAVLLHPDARDAGAVGIGRELLAGTVDRRRRRGFRERLRRHREGASLQ